MGTHPIFESDFDCLTEKPFCYKEIENNREESNFGRKWRISVRSAE